MFLKYGLKKKTSFALDKKRGRCNNREKREREKNNQAKERQRNKKRGISNFFIHT